MPPTATAIGACSALLSLTLASGCGRESPPPDRGAGSPAVASANVASGTPAAADPGVTTARSGEITVGKPPPDFSAKAHDGTDVALSKLKGKPVVLYFYPKDETPGCTKEACAFRDSWNALQQKGVVLVGISTDSLESHKAFAANHKLPFHLVSDPDGAIAKSFGVPNRLGFLARQTFVIGADGNVKKIYRDVDVGKHASEVLADVGS